MRLEAKRRPTPSGHFCVSQGLKQEAGETELGIQFHRQSSEHRGALSRAPAAQLLVLKQLRGRGRGELS